MEKRKKKLYFLELKIFFLLILFIIFLSKIRTCKKCYESREALNSLKMASILGVDQNSVKESFSPTSTTSSTKKSNNNDGICADWSEDAGGELSSDAKPPDLATCSNSAAAAIDPHEDVREEDEEEDDDDPDINFEVRPEKLANSANEDDLYSNLFRTRKRETSEDELEKKRASSSEDVEESNKGTDI